MEKDTASNRVLINDFEDLYSLREKGSINTNWLKVTQSMIDRFADATLDKQWIHVDAEKAKSNSSFGGTIAHGYLLLSLIPYFLNQVIEINNLEMIINYEIKKITFRNSVKPNDKVRLSVKVEKAKDLGEISKVDYNCKMEIFGKENPAFEGTITYLYYFRTK